MNLPPITALGKPKKPPRCRPTPQEGRYIQYRLRLAGKETVTIPRKLGLHNSTVYNVIYGKRHSARIESEIARILGKAGWNEVVLEARSEVQKKPVEVILNEMRRAEQERLEAAQKQWETDRAEGWEESGEVWRKRMAQLEGEKKNHAKRRALV